METVAVIDFETTGMSPTQGARAIEIAAVLVRDGHVVDRFQSLMNADVFIPPFIEHLTGISNAMVRRAPDSERVMRDVADFVGAHPMVAHNASFDQKFWDAELARIEVVRVQAFACTMLLARRFYPDAPDHRLGTLARFAALPVTGRSHRALADAEMAANLWIRIADDLRARLEGASAVHRTLAGLQRVPRAGFDRHLAYLNRRAQ
jgi:DNA polymerase-3 subunit epsilon